MESGRMRDGVDWPAIIHSFRFRIRAGTQNRQPKKDVFSKVNPPPQLTVDAAMRAALLSSQRLSMTCIRQQHALRRLMTEYMKKLLLFPICVCVCGVWLDGQAAESDVRYFRSNHGLAD